ncbi:MAG: fatty acid CoA ligase family protein [Verrucomicrobiota bacterium]
MSKISNVAHFLAEQAIAQPDEPAVRAPFGKEKDGRIRYVEKTFAELEDQASATAHLFLAKGIQRGTRVLLMVKPGLDLIRIVFALFKLGSVPVVIDPGMGLKGFLRGVRHVKPEAVVGIPNAIWISRIFRSSFTSVRSKVCVSRNFAKELLPYVARGRIDTVTSAADDLAAILFTSGSTGPAKGVCYAHGMFAAQIEAIRNQYQIQPGEVDLPMLPVFALFNPALGMCTVVPEMNPSRPATVDPAKIVQAIRQNQVTNSFGSPALWIKIARYCEAESITLPSIKRILIAGAPVPPALMQQLSAVIPNGMIHTPYGATEALPVSSIRASEVLADTAARTLQGEGTCVGKPLPTVKIHVIKPVDGPIQSIDDVVALAPGEIGEIIVQGPSVTRNYDKLPQVDLDSKISEGDEIWHRMGDMGWMDETGRLWFCGRKAERVLTAKGPLYTDCCEAIFNQDPKVFRSALIDVGDGEPGIVVEPESNAFPGNREEREVFIESLQKVGASNELTSGIRHFFFEKSFPVDVRHNAKIHRLSLARKISKTKAPAK